MGRFAVPNEVGAEVESDLEYAKQGILSLCAGVAGYRGSDAVPGGGALWEVPTPEETHAYQQAELAKHKQILAGVVARLNGTVLLEEEHMDVITTCLQNLKGFTEERIARLTALVEGAGAR